MTNVSHEFRTPLNSLISANLLIKERLLRLKTKKCTQDDINYISKWISISDSSAKLLNFFVLDIIDLGHIE